MTILQIICKNNNYIKIHYKDDKTIKLFIEPIPKININNKDYQIKILDQILKRLLEYCNLTEDGITSIITNKYYSESLLLVINNLGIIDLLTGSFYKFIRYLEYGASYGNHNCMNNLASYYSNYQMTMAISWYNKSAIVGNITAIYNLGVIYHKLDSLINTNANCVAYYKAAIHLGSKKAANNLATYYCDSGNYDDGITYYKIALTLDNKVAALSLALLYYDINDFTQAIDYLIIYLNGAKINAKYNKGIMILIILCNITDKQIFLSEFIKEQITKKRITENEFKNYMNNMKNYCIMNQDKLTNADNAHYNLYKQMLKQIMQDTRGKINVYQLK